MSEDPKEEMSRAPLAGAHFARKDELDARMNSLSAPMPEVEGASTSVSRSELMSAIPAQGKDVKPIWKAPGA